MTDKDDAAPMLTHHALGFEPPKKKKVDEDDEDENLPPEFEGEEPKPVFIDPFIDEIRKVKDSQSPAMREAISTAECFGRQWYVDPAVNPAEGGLCPQEECDLRTLCELIYTRVQKIETATTAKEEKEINQEAKKTFRSRKVHRRYPYLAMGRPIDQLADKLWRLVGGPPSLPNRWAYPPSKTPKEQEVAQKIFIELYGSGILVSKRTNYHTFFRDGLHWMKFWVRHPRGGWLDLVRSLSDAVGEITPTMERENMIERMVQPSHRWFSHRVYVSHHQHLTQLGKVFVSMGIAPV